VKSNNKVVFVGQFVEEEESYLDSRISQAGNNYQLRLLKLVNPDFVISLLPIFLDGNKFSRINTNSNLRVSGRGIRNIILRFVYDSYDALRAISKRNCNIIVYYNIDLQNLLLIVLSKYFLKKKVFLIIADFPYFQNNFKSKIVRELVSNLDGAVVFNSNIKVGCPNILSIGFVNDSDLFFRAESFIRPVVLMSGSLGKTTGLELALETFSQLPYFELHISGRPYKYDQNEFDRLIYYYTSNFSNIFFHGLLTKDGYNLLLNKCDIALSLRNPEDNEHQFNFPSKILEYLANSKFVISTLCYSDLDNDLYFKSDFNTENLKFVLNKILNFSPDEVVSMRKLIYDSINKDYSFSSVRNLFLNFFYS
jgi:hypothetical protein